MYEELIEKRKECEKVLNDMIVGLEDLKEKTKNNLLVSGGENVVQSFTKLSKIFNAGIKDIAEAREEFLRDFQVAYSSFNGQNEARLNNEQRWSLGYIKRELENIHLTSEMKEEIKNRISKSLAKIGLQLNSFEILIEERVKRKKSSNTEISHTGFFDSFNNSLTQSKQGTDQVDKNFVANKIVAEKSIENVDQNKKKEYTSSDQANTTIDTHSSNENSSISICPRCQNKLIKGAKYCHRCGYQIN